MNRWRRAWRRWRNGPAPDALNREQEFAYRVLRALVRRSGSALDTTIRDQFEQFAREVEHDRRLHRERR